MKENCRHTERTEPHLSLRIWSFFGKIKFVLVDLNKGEEYPRNFVCLLPVEIHNNLNFVKMCGSKEIAKEKSEQLLQDALERYKDSEPIREAITERLKALEPKPIRLCRRCGKSLENYSYQVRVCFQCKSLAKATEQTLRQYLTRRKTEP